MRCGLKLFTLALILALPLAAAFHRLIAAPASLIVDAEHISVDRACPPHQRGLGNDLTSVFLPRFLYVVQHLRAGTCSGVGCDGFRRQAADRQSANGMVLSTGMARLAGRARRPRWDG